MLVTLVFPIVGGIIATSVGIFLHYQVGERKQSKRICEALCDELEFNLAGLKKSITLAGVEYSIPHPFLVNSYLEARNYGLLRRLPKGIRNSIEGAYSLLQLLNEDTLGDLIRSSPTHTSQTKNETEKEVAKEMDNVLIELKQFCSNLHVYPHHDIACAIRKARGVFRGGNMRRRILIGVGLALVVFGVIIILLSYSRELWAHISWDAEVVALGISLVALGIGFWGLSR